MSSAEHHQATIDRHWLKYAIQLAHQSDPSPSAYCVGAVLVASRAEPNPVSEADRALAELIQRTQSQQLPVQGPHGVVLATGYSRELPGNTHAEEVCFVKVQREMQSSGGGAAAEKTAMVTDADYDWSDATRAIVSHPNVTLYTTMEPCSERLSGRGPCTKHSLALGVRRVVMGIAEPQDIFVKCTGVSTLRDEGVQVVVVQGLEEDCWAPNRHIRPTYQREAFQVR